MFLTSNLISTLKERSNISDTEIELLVKDADQNALALATLMIHKGLLARDVVGMILGDAIGCAYINLEKTLFQDEIVEMLPKKLADQHGAIPIYKFGPAITLAMSDPTDYRAAKAIREAIKGDVDIIFTLPDELETAITVRYQNEDELTELFERINFQRLELLSEEESLDVTEVVKLTDAIFLLALKEGVSDIHIEPKEHRCVIRFRSDGMLRERLSFPANLSRTMTSRFKIMAELDISERRKPQDGRITFQTPIKNIDIRVSTLPSVHGETVVMRLLGSLFGGVPLNLDELNISENSLAPFKSTLKRPNGLILVTGPTGSGKSTTLYAALNFIDSEEVKIMTIEDPVEYEIPSFTQCQINVKAGRTFESVLRAALRQDPDIILVGEMRDTETANISAEAALTGHLVLSTLHANNALQAVTRLTDMGVEPYVIAPSLAGILGQRLVRRLCEHCKAPYTISQDEMNLYFHCADSTPRPTFYRATGCDKCDNYGYKGRVGIHEFVKIDLGMRTLILNQATYTEIREYALGNGFKDMRFDGFSKALKGLTSIDEVVRITATD